MKNTPKKPLQHLKPTGVDTSPMHKAMQALEDAETKFAQVKTKYIAERAEHDRKVAALLANPKPQTKKDRRKQERAWAGELSRLNDEYCAADAAVTAAFDAVAAAKANEIAQRCKSGENLLSCQVGEIVVQKNLSQYYGKECSTVLADYIQPGIGDDELDVDMTYNGYSGPILLTILKPLPTKVEYLTLEKQLFTVPLSELIHRAYHLIDEHRADLQYKQDNASEAAQEGEAYQSRDEQINELESVGEPDVPESVAQIMIYHAPKLGTLSEAARLLKNCLQALKAEGEKAIVSDKLQEFTNSLEETFGVLESVDW